MFISITERATLVFDLHCFLHFRFADTVPLGVVVPGHSHLCSAPFTSHSSR